MIKKIQLSAWELAGEDKVKLVYNDGGILFVKKTDFDRAFGTIINAEKDAVAREFAIEK